MISKAAKGRKKGVSMMYADVSRAYFYAKAVMPAYVQLPEEDMAEGDESRCHCERLSSGLLLILCLFDSRSFFINLDQTIISSGLLLSL